MSSEVVGKQDVTDEPTSTGSAIAVADQAPLDAPAADRRATRGRLLRRLGWSGAAFLLYLCVSVFIQRNTLLHLRTLTTGPGVSDTNFYVWWLRYTPWAIIHGHSPLETTYYNYPDGVNAMWNTTMPVLGILAAPITYSLGPIAALNLLMALAPAVTGWVWFAVMRRYVAPVVALIGGFLWAFSPFELAHLNAHANLVWNFFPPLVLLFTDELFFRQRIKPVRLGTLFGLLLAVQLGVYLQTIFTTMLVASLVWLVIIVRWRNEIRRRARYVIQTLAVAAVVFLVVCAYPIYLFLLGKNRAQGSYRDPYYFVSDLANIIIPTRWELFQFGQTHRALFLRSSAYEEGFYLGIPIIVVLICTLIFVRTRLVRLIALGGLLAAVLSLGPSLVILGQPKHIALPWRWLIHVGPFGNLETVRFGLLSCFAATVLVAVVLDRALRLSGRRRLFAVGAIGLAALTWLPTLTLPHSPLRIPEFFRTSAVKDTIANGEVVRTVPRPSQDAAHAIAMTWQAAANFRYKTPGGYFIGATQDGDTIKGGVPDAFDNVTDAIAAGNPAPQPGQAAFRAAAEAVGSKGVSVLLVVPLPDRHTFDELQFAQAVTGIQPKYVQGVWVFRLRPPPDLRRPGPDRQS
jgi:hypothetical protein